MATGSNDASSLLTFGNKRSFVTQSGLATVLDLVRKNGLPEHSSRRTIKRKREQAVAVETCAGPLWGEVQLRMTTGEVESFPVIRPQALLAECARRCKPFAAFFQGLHERNPSSPTRPWRICVYSDEVTPGNTLKVNNARKFVVFYYSMMEFSPAISNEHIWFNCFTMRTSQALRVEGGVSQITKAIIRTFFAPPFSFNDGVLFLLEDGSRQLLYAKIATIVADEVALKQMFSFKGAAGIMFCWNCQNVCSMSSGLASCDPTAKLVPSTEWNTDKFILSTDESILRAAALLTERKPHLSNAAFDRLEKSVGLTYSPHGFLFDEEAVRSSLIGGPVSATMYDWVHTFMVNGIWNNEVGCLFEKLETEKVLTNQEAHQFFSSFQWPRKFESRSVTGANIFQKRKGARAGDMKCSASECLGSYSVLRLFLMEHFAANAATPEAQRCLDSYFALAGVIDLLQGIARGQTTGPQLHHAIQQHFQLTQRAFGSDIVVPKNHYALHLGKSLADHGTLIGCLTHERKHREVKRFGDHHTSATQNSSFERSLLESVTLTSFRYLEEFVAPGDVALVNARPASTILQAHAVKHLEVPINTPVEAAEVAFFRTNETVQRGDVAIAVIDSTPTVGEIWLHLGIQGEILTCWSPWVPLGKNRFHIQKQPCFIPTSSIERVCIYRTEGDKALVVP